MTSPDQLRAAKALIDTPEKWTQGHYARDRAGYPAGPRSHLACRFCILGAFIRSAGTEVPAYGLSDFIPKDTPADRSVSSYNDHPSTTHADIMALFDRAIAASLTNTEAHPHA
jgi:hypothetical protein